MKRMSATEYRKLCREVHRKFGKPMNMPYHESCACADDVYFGLMTKDALFSLLREALADTD